MGTKPLGKKIKKLKEEKGKEIYIKKKEDLGELGLPMAARRDIRCRNFKKEKEIGKLRPPGRRLQGPGKLEGFSKRLNQEKWEHGA